MDADDSRSRSRVRKRISYAEDSDDDEMNNNNNDSDDDSDDESDMSPVKKKRTSAPARRQTAKKPTARQSSVRPKKQEESDDNEDDASDGDSNNSSDSDEGSDENLSDTDDEVDDEPRGSKKRSMPAKRAATKKAAKKVKKSKPKTASDRSRPLKELTRLERLEEARRAYKWWEAKELPNGANWRKLEHPGVLFAPPYKRHNVPLLYNGSPVDLTDEQEEIATFFAAMPEDGPQLGNPKTSAVFKANFFNGFLASLPPGHVIKKLELCDFSRIKEHLDMQRSLKKAATDEEKAIAKKEKEGLVLRFGYAMIDGRLEKMGNYNMEPPGLFRGRGEHPLTGMIKRRCFAESVDVNVSLDSCPPKCMLPGHAWASVRHDPMVTWLCAWQENVQQQHKYVMLAASSSFKGKSDLEKYDKAIRLSKYIGKVRRDYTTKIKSKDLAERQLGTAMWVIDVLALRVGGEKGEDEADTVGCCSLRVEHLKFLNPTAGEDEEGSHEIELEFLGKDSMLFKQTINFAKYDALGKRVFRNLKSFCAGKSPNQDVFEKLTPPILNKHLTSLMPGLTAKVFRTYNASITLEKELPSAQDLEGLTIQEKIVRYNAANREVAILCNHQKTVSKATEAMFENLNEKLETLKTQRRQLIKWKDLAKRGQASKIPLKKDDSSVVERIAERVKQALRAKETAKTNEQKLAAAAALEEAKADQKNDQKRRYQEKHMLKTTPTESSLSAKIERWNDDIRRMETDIRNRDENKEVALGTSKINYMDPRISVAWCKRCEVPIDKVFAKTLREKFNWAMAVPPDWKFEP